MTAGNNILDNNISVFLILFLVATMTLTYHFSSQDVDAFSHCDEPPSPFVNLSGCDLTDKNFINVDFSNADLSNADMSGADLSGSSFVGVSMENSILRGANLEGADLRNVDLTTVDFETDDLKGANTEGTKLPERGFFFFRELFAFFQSLFGWS